MLDPTWRPFVEQRRVLATRHEKLITTQDLLCPSIDEFAAVAVRQTDERVAVSGGRVVVLHRRPITLVPMREQIAIEIPCPGDATFHKGKGQPRKALRHPS